MTTETNNFQMDNHLLLEDAVRIARLAGTLLRDNLNSDFAMEYKGEVDIVTEMDRRAQGIIEAEIRTRYPNHGILAEEGLNEKGTGGYLWVVDPLDGTTNYAHGFPIFSVSIAVMHKGRAVCGVVYNPVSEEIFKAIAGQGAFLNAYRIDVSATSKLDRSLLATGFPYNIRETADTNLDYFSRFAVSTQGIRRCGSAALDLCFVAAGRLDGFWELNLKPWDIAAGALVVREAGGVITDFSGRDIDQDGSRVVASNGSIHQEMLELIGAPPAEG
jgi:myo-inositol-1(or 4)-monophosphatase